MQSDLFDWFILYKAGLELSASNEVRVKYGFILRLKKLLLKSISQQTQIKRKSKQTNKQKRKKNQTSLYLG